MQGLGRLFDLGVGWVPVDLDDANGATGKRISMENASAITFVVFAGTGPAGFTVDVQQHTAYTGGTSADLDSTGVSTSTGVTEWYVKSEAALDNDESWTRVTQSEASECDIGTSYGLLQKLVAIHVPAHALGAGYTHVSLTATSDNGTACLCGCLYVLHDLKQQRTPANLPNLLNPGAANA
jgi:hypothetical protein